MKRKVVHSKIRKNLLVGFTALGIAASTFVVTPQRSDALALGIGSSCAGNGPNGSYWCLTLIACIFLFPLGIILETDGATCPANFKAFDWKDELYSKLNFLKGTDEGRKIEEKVIAQLKSAYLDSQQSKLSDEELQTFLENRGIQVNSGRLSVKLDSSWVQDLLETGGLYSDKKIKLAKTYLDTF